MVINCQKKITQNLDLIQTSLLNDVNPIYLTLKLL